ncbi:Sec-independent protein translocase subunit TatA [Microbacterium sp. cx-55]|uniref:Sec-independent protein translocase subunit TatA n=1 Tax=unclassified Microbacterium TaxID=2609290 RepID=UPI001CBF2D3A|nr:MULTISPECIES: Sec-independent protein translocase subunit TatA [unclassified Microbacterium]MBZ4486456.1 Sec-independent protein translocase subunit TatA [Microbacterium sp. cx-55]MCC4907428.1 Sec-independent protein translocase subunit TatA [Microbacterium sp. cx-59]UGB36573.1 Sec-independent protein translocase subunit TatA [Microbacterium sp. cx-55]
MLQNLTGWHFLIILLVILLLFGAAKLPALARSLGQSARVFKGEMKEMKKDDEQAGYPASTPPSAPASQVGTTVPGDSASRTDGTDSTPR